MTVNVKTSLKHTQQNPPRRTPPALSSGTGENQWHETTCVLCDCSSLTICSLFKIVLDWLVQPKPRWLGGNGWLLDGPEEVLQGTVSTTQHFNHLGNVGC